MTPEALADLCARAYLHMSPWNAEQFDATLARETSLLHTGEHAFVLGQVILDEVEILALATDPDQQRSGAASAALGAFFDAAMQRGARRVFLEVSTENIPALRFYEKHGFVTVGRRKGYYPKHGAPAVDAHVMARDLP